MGIPKAKGVLCDALASVAEALGSARRPETAAVLARGRGRVKDLAADTGKGVADTSQHLQVLLLTGLREGTTRVCCGWPASRSPPCRGAPR